MTVKVNLFAKRRGRPQSNVEFHGLIHFTWSFFQFASSLQRFTITMGQKAGNYSLAQGIIETYKYKILNQYNIPNLILIVLCIINY